IHPPFPSRLPSNNISISDITVNPTIVLNILLKLKTNASAGPDRLPNIFYKSAAHSLAFPLATIFRSFIDIHDIPSEWKISIISPKFKKGSSSDPANYRPIALTCSICKVLETIIVSDLLTFLQTHHLISKAQHGFLKRHSTCTNLLETLNDWTLSLSNHKSVLAAYVDFSRAFDSLSHAKLLHKLSGYGITGNLFLFIEAFLSNRSQLVRLSLVLSSPLPVISGVPQGSVLGPLLFILFINDISDNFDNNVIPKLFADDIKLYTEVTLPSASQNFQILLDYIQNWATLWQIGISYSKCFIINLGQRCNDNSFKFLTNTITKSDLVKDLGILIEPNLKFDRHIHDLISRANQRAALVHRSFLSRDVFNLIRAFKTYIRPILEYSSPAWSPCLINQINALESVQRKFTKRLPSFGELTYAERLTNLKLQSLEHRRLMIDLITVFKIVHGLVSLSFQDFFTFSPNVHSSRGHSLRFSVPLTRTNTRKFFFASRVINSWNSLPDKIVSSPNTQSFKNKLSKFDLSKHLIHPCILH
ncbi:MAG: reverse transcriptase family protein, partial [Oscillospiraceae bacterium]